MNRSRSPLLLAVLLVGIAATALAERSREKVVPLENLSPAVRETILREAAGNAILEVKKVQEDGLNFIEAEWMEDGMEIEVQVDFKGELLSRKIEAPDGDDD